MLLWYRSCTCVVEVSLLRAALCELPRPSRPDPPPDDDAAGKVITATDREDGNSFVELANAAAAAAAAAGVVEFPPGVAGVTGTGGLTSYARR